MEYTQKFLCRAVQPRTARHLQVPALLNELALLQQAHRIRAVHAAHLIDVGAGGGLVVGNDGQHLQRRLAQLCALADLERLADDVRIVRRGAELVEILHPYEADAAPVVGIVIPQLLQQRLCRLLIQIKREADAVDAHRLAGGEQNALDRRLKLL